VKPESQLFTWFFVVPGLLLVLLSGYGLFGSGELALVGSDRANGAITSAIPTRRIGQSTLRVI
jgi:hypothetical protein